MPPCLLRLNPTFAVCTRPMPPAAFHRRQLTWRPCAPSTPAWSLLPSCLTAPRCWTPLRLPFAPLVTSWQPLLRCGARQRWRRRALPPGMSRWAMHLTNSLGAMHASHQHAVSRHRLSFNGRSKQPLKSSTLPACNLLHVPAQLPSPDLPPRSCSLRWTCRRWRRAPRRW